MIDWICARLDHPREVREDETGFRCYTCLCGKYLTWADQFIPMPRVRTSWLWRLVDWITP